MMGGVPPGDRSVAEAGHSNAAARFGRERQKISAKDLASRERTTRVAASTAPRVGQDPRLAILNTHQSIGLRTARNPFGCSIPRDFLARAIGDVAQMGH